MKLMPRVPRSMARARPPVCRPTWNVKSSPCRCSKTYVASDGVLTTGGRLGDPAGGTRVQQRGGQQRRWRMHVTRGGARGH